MKIHAGGVCVFLNESIVWETLLNYDCIYGWISKIITLKYVCFKIAIALVLQVIFHT